MKYPVSPAAPGTGNVVHLHPDRTPTWRIVQVRRPWLHGGGRYWIYRVERRRTFLGLSWWSLVNWYWSDARAHAAMTDALATQREAEAFDREARKGPKVLYEQ